MTAFRWRHLAKNSVLSLMVVLWLGINAFSFFPQLHRLLHQDSGNLNHECLFTLIQKSHLLTDSMGAVGLPLPALGLGFLALAQVFCLTALYERFSPSRAPPVRLLISRVG